MHHHYADIRSRILSPPEWWDEYGVPRYDEFDPDETSNIYATEVVLLLIACQDCDTEFKVCLTRSNMDRARGAKTLAELVESDEIHYGDPPNTGCCGAGPTMNSVPLRVLEFWDRSASAGGHRRPELERDINCEWAMKRGTE